MDLTHAELSSTGPVRSNNEDFISFWEPIDAEMRRTYGSVAILADGVGGLGHGEVASQLAVQTAMKTFREAKPDTSPQQLLWQMFTAANLAVYNAGMDQREGGRMATTLVVSVFRNHEVTVGNVGDCRVYLIKPGTIQRITVDHSYVGMQMKMGILSAEEAQNSELKNVLTRSLGQDPTIRVDYFTMEVAPGDKIVQCCDGVHGSVSELEIMETVESFSPMEACRHLVSLAELHGATDNLSVQITQVDKIERLSYYRGVATYRDEDQRASPAVNDLQPDQELDRRFRIVDAINRSGMATIYRAVDLTNNQVVALKVPFMQFESDPGFHFRFEREEAIGKALNHPYILHVIPVEEKSRPYFAMELLEGQTLDHLMRRAAPMPEPDALSIGSRLCEALEYMHEHGIIHRDLKPQNIMVCRDNSLRVMDFGIAKAASMRRITFTGLTAAIGTPDYMAPEQVKGKRGDARTDIYSLGALLYEMLTGKTPFEGQNPYAIMNARLSGDPRAPRKINPNLSPQVEEILLHALARDPHDRYQTAAEMKHDLDHPQDVMVTDRHARLRSPKAWRPHNRTAWLYGLCIGIPIIIMIVALLIANHKRL